MYWCGGQVVPVAKFYKYDRWLCQVRGAAAALFCAVFAGAVFMTGPGAAQSAQPAGQRLLPVVSVSCDSDLRLCQALVQALSQAAPSQIYRINPSPRPLQAFDVRIDLSRPGQAHLTWQGAQEGAQVRRAGLSEAALSRALIHASPELIRALRARQPR